MALLRYTALRVALFLATAAVLYLVGVRDLLVCALVAILVSGLISVVALKGVRSEVVVRAPKAKRERTPRQSPFKRLSERIDAAARAEDEADDVERDHLGHPLPPIARPDLQGWEDHVPETEPAASTDDVEARERP
jgi:hypothetical protein